MPALTPDAKYTRLDGAVFMTGVQALVRLALDQARRDRAAGLRTAGLVTGYQGSPLAGLDLELGRRRALLDELGVHHKPALNEELAATAILGSQLAHTVRDAHVEGVVGIWYGKAPGLDRAVDAIRHANMIGVERNGGALVAVGDDALSKSSTLPSSSESTFHSLLVPFVSPADPQEVLDLGLHAIALSRASGLWAGMKIATNVADGSGVVVVDGERVRPVTVPMELDGRPYRHRVTATLLGPQQLELERTLHYARLDAAARYAVANGLNRVLFAGEHDRVGIVASGKTWLDLRQALRELGLDDEALERSPIRLLKVAMPYPLAPSAVREFAAGLDEVVVVEEKRAFVELLLKDVLCGLPGTPRVVGKRDEDGVRLVPAERELDADVIAAAIGGRLAAWLPKPLAALAPARTAAPAAAAAGVAAPLPARLPWFCSGCPHSSSTQVPDGALVGGGIGCHAMVMLMDRSRVGDVIGVTQMGGEGTQWIGMAPFTGTGHIFQNVGDGTFLHSGSLALRAAVAAGVNVTYKILFNSAVAMTGGQHAVGAMDVPRMTRLLEAEGVRRTIVTSEDPARLKGARLAAGVEVWDRSRLVDAQQALAATPGVTVLIHDQECAAELRRKRKRGRAPDPPQRVFVAERVCEGCGDCGAKSNCLSVQPVSTEFGEKTRIHQSSCNKDYVCVEGDCPSFLTVIPAKDGGRRAVAPAAPAAPAARADLTPADLPEPAAAALPATVRIVGVGGTGVITVAQILGTAALLDGLHVKGLDQTGLAQKGGPVVSDVKLFAAPTDAGAKATGGECDLYLGCDLLAAADDRYLAAASPQRTRAVVSTAQTATGPMVSTPGDAFPDPRLPLDKVSAATRADDNAYLDPQALALALFGAEATANVLLLGVAFQLGELPVSADALEQAIELNGASVAQNLQAFRRGRQWVADRAALEAAVDAAGGGASGGGAGGGDGAPAAALDPRLARAIERVGAPAGGELERLLRVRVPDLADYHDLAYAERYAAFVGQVAAVEAERVQSTELAEAVAVGLHKLMAFKDEYEVARLQLDPQLRREIEARFGAGARVQWNLHPPLLRELGLKRKLRLGAWFAGPLRLLRALRRLRFTPLDPFGRAAVRRLERELIDEYRATVASLLADLSAERHATAVAIAALPDLVRGYEQVKLGNVERYRERMSELLAEHARAAVAAPR